MIEKILNKLKKSDDYKNHNFQFEKFCQKYKSNGYDDFTIYTNDLYDSLNSSSFEENDESSYSKILDQLNETNTYIQLSFHNDDLSLSTSDIISFIQRGYVFEYDDFNISLDLKLIYSSSHDDFSLKPGTMNKISINFKSKNPFKIYLFDSDVDYEPLLIGTASSESMAKNNALAISKAFFDYEKTYLQIQKEFDFLEIKKSNFIFKDKKFIELSNEEIEELENKIADLTGIHQPLLIWIDKYSGYIKFISASADEKTKMLASAKEKMIIFTIEEKYPEFENFLSWKERRIYSKENLPCFIKIGQNIYPIKIDFDGIKTLRSKDEIENELIEKVLK